MDEEGRRFEPRQSLYRIFVFFCKIDLEGDCYETVNRDCYETVKPGLLRDRKPGLLKRQANAKMQEVVRINLLREELPSTIVCLQYINVRDDKI